MKLIKSLSYINRNTNFLFEANPYKTVESISKLLTDHIHETSNKDIVIFNKPPGFVYLDKSKDNGLIDVFLENVKRKLNWQKCLRVPLITNAQSGICILVSNKETFDLVKKTMNDIFTSNHVAFLTFYGISAMIPSMENNKEVFNVTYENIDNRLVYYEDKNPSKNKLKSNKTITYQIEHRVIDFNRDFNIALIEFKTAIHYGDGIQIYCTKQLSPLLGDHVYSNRVSKILGNPVLVPEPKNVKPEPQILSNRVTKILDINQSQSELVPLHLHLSEINIEKKFKKQKLVLQHRVSILPYFQETLKRFALKIK